MSEEYYIDAINKLYKELCNTDRQLSNADLLAIANTVVTLRRAYPDTKFKGCVDRDRESNKLLVLYLPYV